MVKRSALSKKLRFEVFKRDFFTCQYCGRKAPDVVLHVDHITPVSRGGKNIIMNLVTSCYECNQGKRAESLDEQSVVEKGRRQAELLQERREQISMIRDWHLSLAEQDDYEVEAVNDIFLRLTDGKYSISSGFRPTIKKIVRKYGLDEVINAMKDGFEGYRSPDRVLNKLSGICACRKNPYFRKRSYILAIMENRVAWHFNRNTMGALIDRGYAAGGDQFLERLEAWSKGFDGTWATLRSVIESAVEEWESLKNG